MPCGASCAPAAQQLLVCSTPLNLCCKPNRLVFHTQKRCFRPLYFQNKLTRASHLHSYINVGMGIFCLMRASYEYRIHPCPAAYHLASRQRPYLLHRLASRSLCPGAEIGKVTQDMKVIQHIENYLVTKRGKKRRVAKKAIARYIQPKAPVLHT